MTFLLTAKLPFETLPASLPWWEQLGAGRLEYSRVECILFLRSCIIRYDGTLAEMQQQFLPKMLTSVDKPRKA